MKNEGVGEEGTLLVFRWSKKAKITSETISFLKNISFSMFKFSTSLHIMKVCRWNLNNFSKFTNTFIRKIEKSWTLFYNNYFIKPFKMTINRFLFLGSFCSQDFFLFCKLVRSPIFAFWYQDRARNITRENWERQIARNGKLQYLFQK